MAAIRGCSSRSEGILRQATLHNTPIREPLGLYRDWLREHFESRIMKSIKDYKGILPYASELFGIYQPAGLAVPGVLRQRG